MGNETAKIITSIREKFSIPANGFKNEEEALDWYRRYYQGAKGKPFRYGFGFRFDITKRILEFDYKYDDANRQFTIGFIPPIDRHVPFDQSVLLLAQADGLNVFLAPALRLVVLVGSIQEQLPEIPSYAFVQLGSFRLLVQSPEALSNEQRRKLLDDLKPPQASQITGYWVKRKRQKIGRYLEVLRAYYDWIDEKRERQKKGIKVSKKGYLVWMAERLVKFYGWQLKPSSYTVKRYLDRATELWRFTPFGGNKG